MNARIVHGPANDLLRTGPLSRRILTISAQDSDRVPAHQRVITLILMMVLHAASAGAGDFECVVVTQDASTMFRRADVVFVGLLKRIEFGDKLIFQVDRVWKGRV